MPTLDHVNIHTRDPDRMREFLAVVVGVREGRRPPFSNPGHWLYLQDRAVIHLDVIEAERDLPQGVFHHVAFELYDFDERLRALEECGYPFEQRDIPGTDLGQFFVRGPEGVLIELQYKRPSKSGS